MNKHWLDYLTAIFALFAAIASSFTAGFSGWQRSIAADTEERQLRAYVIVSSQGMKNIVLDQKAQSTAIWDNVGQTPVYDATWEAGINVLLFPMTGEFSYADCGAIMKDPSAKHSFFGKQIGIEKSRSQAFTKEEMPAIDAGTSAVYFNGRICYKDIFNKVRRTDFCMYWRKGENGSYCDKGNDGD